MEDIEMSFTSNMAAMNIFAKGIANSASVMIPCAWAPDYLAALKRTKKLAEL